MRSPVGLSTTSDGSLIVVCDDGTVWTYTMDSDPNKRWQRKDPPVPGSLENPAP
jgi:hypothetical protein